MPEEQKTDFLPIKRTPQEARKAYNQMSSWYDLFSGFEKDYREKGIQLLKVKPGEKILEIGSGTGNSLLILGEKVGTSGKVYGIDISEGMVKVSKSKLRQANLMDRVILTCGNALELPYEDNFFDGIFICFTLELFAKPEITLFFEECKRVLKIKGRMGIVSMEKKKRDSVMVKIYELFHKLFPRWIDCRPIPVKDLLEKNGLKINSYQQFRMWGLPVAIVKVTQK
ncbi:MAG: class I SAM-dependent methyltransferase [Asgard group archaeon]|nr:class I SAM-dependent methyltransferase [Asgard group archaeon]